MFCPNCGAEVSEKAVVCVKCGVGINNSTFKTPMDESQPKTWLVESILVTLFCCLPFGIAGIVNAANVSAKYGAGDLEGSKRASKQAGKWTKWAFWLGLIGLILYFLFIFILGGISTLLK
jgi:hypothetical protein